MDPFSLFTSLPEKWQRRLEAHIRELSNGKYRTPGARHFTQQIKLNFSDGSRVNFRYAFHLVDEADEEIAVFTEHCGYHIFPLIDTTIEIIES